MAVTDAYFTTDEYQAAADLPIAPAGVLAVVARQALSISRFIDNITNTFFTKDAAPVMRRFDAGWLNEIHFDDYDRCPGLANKTGLVVSINNGQTLTEGVDFLLEPMNAALGPEPRPYTYMRVSRFTSPTISSFYSSDGFVYVTGIWGWDSVPNGIKDAAIELCAIWRDESPRSVGRASELERVVNVSSEAKILVERIRKSYGKLAIA